MAVNTFIKRAVKKLFPSLFYEAPKPEDLYKRYINLSFSQEGEDLVLNRLFENKENGFYVDVGAHHPYRFSNTYKFYLKGWNGINIDALPGSMQQFNTERSRDINIESAILNTSQPEATYFMFDDAALNTFDEAQAVKIDTTTPYKLVNKQKIKTSTLATVLNNNLAANTVIDFLSVDVEGKDLEVLQSNDWNKYLPVCIIVESLETNLISDQQSYIANYLKTHNYTLIAKTANSLFFKHGV